LLDSLLQEIYLKKVRREQDGTKENINPEDFRREEQTGHFHQAQVWVDEESLRAERPMRLRDRRHHL